MVLRHLNPKSKNIRQAFLMGSRSMIVSPFSVGVLRLGPLLRLNILLNALTMFADRSRRNFCYQMQSLLGLQPANLQTTQRLHVVSHDQMVDTAVDARCKCEFHFYPSSPTTTQGKDIPVASRQAVEFFRYATNLQMEFCNAHAARDPQSASY